MFKDMLKTQTGILEDLHADHEEVAGLLEQIQEAKGTARRAKLFREMKAKLIAHAQAEQKVLYRKLEKSDDEESRHFGFEGTVEHELAESLLDELARGRNKESDEWEGRFTVLKELVEHHVEEEESEGFECSRREFDNEQLEKLRADFRREKEKLLQRNLST